MDIDLDKDYLRICFVRCSYIELNRVLGVFADMPDERAAIIMVKAKETGLLFGSEHKSDHKKN